MGDAPSEWGSWDYFAGDDAPRNDGINCVLTAEEALESRGNSSSSGRAFHLQLGELLHQSETNKESDSESKTTLRSFTNSDSEGYSIPSESWTQAFGYADADAYHRVLAACVASKDTQTAKCLFEEMA